MALENRNFSYFTSSCGDVDNDNEYYHDHCEKRARSVHYETKEGHHEKYYSKNVRMTGASVFLSIERARHGCGCGL